MAKVQTRRTISMSRAAYVAADTRAHELGMPVALALDTVAALLDVLARTGGYMPHDDQATLRAAEALLVEHGYVDDGARTRRNSLPGRSAP